MRGWEPPRLPPQTVLPTGVTANSITLPLAAPGSRTTIPLEPQGLLSRVGGNYGVQAWSYSSSRAAVFSASEERLGGTVALQGNTGGTSHGHLGLRQQHPDIERFHRLRNSQRIAKALRRTLVFNAPQYYFGTTGTNGTAINGGEIQLGATVGANAILVNPTATIPTVVDLAS